MQYIYISVYIDTYIYTYIMFSFSFFQKTRVHNLLFTLLGNRDLELFTHFLKKENIKYN